jgi:precorrin-3B C17-methyltransferase
MNAGRLTVVGLGPGAAGLCTPDASAALAEATDLIGYATYLDRVALLPGQMRHPTDNRVELDRARHALALAAEGRNVAVVSSGDPGVFAMASAVFEAMERGPAEWRALDVAVIPGVSAMFAVAARLGAPLGHDFCAISLSDNLKPWALVLRRLTAAAAAGFVIALYNPRSRARPEQLGLALDALRDILPGRTPVVFARAVGRDNERLAWFTLDDSDPAQADMATMVLVGSADTREIAGADGRRWLYTPRSAC